MEERGTTSFCAGCGATLDLVRCEACGAAKEAGGYRVLKMLHESDHARVYLAEDASGARVALKELIYARAPDAQTIEAFEREAALLRQVSHPAIPRFVASFREGQGTATRLYLAQEFVEGQSLAQKLETHRFDEAEARRFADAVLRILAYLHGLSPPLVHRDVKPANLIVRPDGTIALVDFGCAREVAPRGTHRATVTGTFGYMPPEALGGTLDRSADLYGLGATLVHLLSRKAPEELLWEKPASALRDELNVSPPLLAFIQRLTARDRASRFPSAAEALANFPRDDAQPAGLPRGGRGVRQQRQRRQADPTVAEAQPPIATRPAPPVPAAALHFGLAQHEREEREIKPVAWFMLVAFLLMTGSFFIAHREATEPVARPPVSRVAPPSLAPRPPAEEQPRAEHGVLSVTLPTLANVWLDGVRLGRGSQRMTLRQPSGELIVGNAGQQRVRLAYRAEGGQLLVTATNLGGSVVVDGVARGTQTTVAVPSGGVEIRGRSATGQLRHPITLGYLPASR